MRSKHFLGLLLVAGTAVAAVSSGCGGDVETGAGGNGGEGGTDTTTTTGTTMTTGTSMTTGTGGTGGMGGMGACADDKDGNCDFDTAEEIEFNAESLAADLEPVDEDEDFYTFEGKAGQALFIYTDAKPADDEYSKEYADLVITLYDESGKRVAENDADVAQSRAGQPMEQRSDAGGVHVDGDDVALRAEQRHDRIPGPAGQTLTMQEHQRLTGADTVIRQPGAQRCSRFFLGGAPHGFNVVRR